MQTKIEITYGNDSFDLHILKKLIPAIRSLVEINNKTVSLVAPVEIYALTFETPPSNHLDSDYLIILKKARAKRKPPESSFAIYPPDAQTAAEWK